MRVWQRLGELRGKCLTADHVRGPPSCGEASGREHVAQYLGSDGSSGISPDWIALMDFLTFFSSIFLLLGNISQAFLGILGIYAAAVGILSVPEISRFAQRRPRSVVGRTKHLLIDKFFRAPIAKQTTNLDELPEIGASKIANILRSTSIQFVEPAFAIQLFMSRFPSMLGRLLFLSPIIVPVLIALSLVASFESIDFLPAFAKALIIFSSCMIAVLFCQEASKAVGGGLFSNILILIKPSEVVISRNNEVSKIISISYNELSDISFYVEPFKVKFIPARKLILVSNSQKERLIIECPEWAEAIFCRSAIEDTVYDLNMLVQTISFRKKTDG